MFYQVAIILGIVTLLLEDIIVIITLTQDQYPVYNNIHPCGTLKINVRINNNIIIILYLDIYLMHEDKSAAGKSFYKIHVCRTMSRHPIILFISYLYII